MMAKFLKLLGVLQMLNINLAGSSTVSSTTEAGTTTNETIQLACGVKVNALVFPDGRIDILLSRVTPQGLFTKKTTFEA